MGRLGVQAHVLFAQQSAELAYDELGSLSSTLRTMTATPLAENGFWMKNT
jgi:hypothetical protein